jgi:hypothetical protein
MRARIETDAAVSRPMYSKGNGRGQRFPLLFYLPTAEISHIPGYQ